MNKVLEKYRNRLIQQRYSHNTIDIYGNYFKDFCNFFKNSDMQNIKPEQINKYILDLFKTKNISASKQNQRMVVNIKGAKGIKVKKTGFLFFHRNSPCSPRVVVMEPVLT